MNGLFAEHGLDVEILDPSGGPDNVVLVGRGDSDFALTSVNHYLSARARHGVIAARFVAMVVQRSPVGAMVRSSSAFVSVADLAGARLGGDPENPQVIEFLASLEWRGFARPALVELDNVSAREAMARGEVDGIIGLVDAMPRRRTQSGIDLRAIRVGRDDVYASGVIASDGLADETVAQLRTAVGAALEAQRDRPESGLDIMTARYADERTGDAPEGWRMTQEYVFTDGVPVGSMDAATWRTTLDFLCRIRGLPVPDPESVYRPQLTGAPVRA